MLLAEQVRNLANEENVVNHATDYLDTAITDWVTKVTHNITVAEAGLLILAAEMSMGTTSSDEGGVRVLLDDVPILCSGGVRGNVGTLKRYGMTPISAGAHTIKQQSAVWQDNNAWLYWRDLKAGVIHLSDLTKSRVDSGFNNVAATASYDSFSADVNVPATRNLCCGQIGKYLVHIFVIAYADDCRLSDLKNAAEGGTANRLNWWVKKDTVKIDWTERRDEGFYSLNPTMGEGCHGYVAFECSPGESFHIDINVVNNTAGAEDVRTIVSIIITPWIFPFSGEYMPIDFDFPEGSTLYLVLEPLFSNPTKYVRFGKARAIPFTGCDYYASESGVDIIQWDYTFELFEIDAVELTLEGWGAILTVFGVDIR